ncbi:hypothetical protein [Nonomuraea sediminis]|uniref:hypothetical protein n=1 Tax=Nonomuraea sediminis TaxID=2835864 RepID=UPI001BDCE744|nr:hypothetical protein [Nonomuraea sediminis]
MKSKVSLVSLAALAVGALWLAFPGTYPYGAADKVTVGVTHWIERDLGASLMLASGALGLLFGRFRAVAAVEAAFFLFVMSDAAVLSSLGYGAIPVMAVGVVGLVVIGCVRRHPAGYVAAVLLVAVAAWLISSDVITTYLGNLGKGLGVYGGRVGWSWAMAIAAGTWGWTAFGDLIRHGSVGRWGRLVTVLATLGGVPYAVARLSWATPWPLGGYDPVTERIVLVMPGGDPATRLQGLLIGAGAVMGVVLTFGLISRWGEVFPRWMPIVRGRPVPVMLAVVPGAFVSAALCISAPGVLAGAAQTKYLLDAFLFVLLFPCPIWGPLLGAAVLSYWQRRRSADQAIT